jgi:hypothetical protein
LWDVAARKRTTTLDAYVLAIKSLAYSPDGKTLAVNGSGTINLFDMSVAKSASK